MQGRRDQFIVATKIGWLNYDAERNQSAYDTVEKFIVGVESNLRRLDTDYIDVMQSHIHYEEATLDVFLEGFQRLQQAGKIRAYGVSASDFEYLKRFNEDGGCATLQIDYSILNRTAEAEILPYCEEHNIGVIVRGALAMGILTGKYDADTRFGPDDFRRRWHENPEEYEVFLQDLEKVEQLRPLAEDRTLAQLALQFVLAHPAVATVIPGAKNTSLTLNRAPKSNVKTIKPLGAKRKQYFCALRQNGSRLYRQCSTCVRVHLTKILTTRHFVSF